MTIEDVSNLLYEKVNKFYWFVAIGIGKISEKDVLYLYVNSTKDLERDFPERILDGFPIIIQTTSRPRPA